jgi:hypothetical protein
MGAGPRVCGTATLESGLWIGAPVRHRESRVVETRAWASQIMLDGVAFTLLCGW